MRTLHLALASSNIDLSVANYSSRLGALPVVVIPWGYVLWRTDALNLSIRNSNECSGVMRHLGWKDTEAAELSTETDCNGVVWEKYTASHQAQEINEI
jgi:hypothetical protein